MLMVSMVVSVFATNRRYRIAVNDDPATAMTIGWEQTGGSGAMVHYGPVDFGTAFASYPFTHGIDRQVSAKGMDNCFARLTGLLPDTEYYFVINDSDGTSQRMWFKTLPYNSNDPISLIAGGDSRIYLDNSARENANELVAKLKPDAIMFAGDFTWLDLDLEWEAWFDDWQLTIASDGRMSPIIVARGNHEYLGQELYDLFDTPSSDEYYAINLGGDLLRLYSLNTEVAMGGTQRSWLEADLIATGDNVDWKFAQYHQPMRPHVSSEPEGNDQYNNWAQLFYDYGVRLVLDCDSHDTKITWPVEPSTSATSEEGFEREDINGTIYIGEGGWGVPLRTNDDSKSWTRDAGSFNSFHWIIVERDTVQIRTINTDNAASVGEVLNSDRFTPPANLDIWNPSNGPVAYLVNNKYLGRPMVDVTYPYHHQYFGAPQLVTITADAVDTNGSVDYVEFFINDTPIGTDNSFPYSLDWTMPSDGSYIITAWAFDNEGIHNISDDIKIFVGDMDITSQIQASDDDAEEYKSDGSVDLTSADLEFCVEEWPWPLSDEDQWLGLRFQGIDIPNGAIVNSAYIEFTADESQSSGASMTIYGQDDDNPSSFSGSSNDISSRTRTGASVTWSPNGWSSEEIGPDTQTDDLSSIIQEIIDRPGWVPGNSMGFIFEGTGTRSAYSFDTSPSKSAKLYINVSGPVTVTEDDHLDIEIYPNPASNYLFVSAHNGKDDMLVNLFTINGRLVQSEILSDKINCLSLSSSIQPGAYIVEVIQNNELAVKKIIIQN